MSTSDISGISYFVDEDGGRCVHDMYSIPVNVTTLPKQGKGLPGLLKRIKQSLSMQDRTPALSLKQSFWYKDVCGCPTKKELKRALKTCKITNQEADMIHKHFPNEYGGIDFKMLVSRVFSNECDRRKYINLRQENLRASQFPGYQQQSNSVNPGVNNGLQSTGRFDATATMEATQAVGQAQAF